MKRLKNKQGMATLKIFIFCFYAFLIIMGIGIAVLMFNLINDALDEDIQMGQVNLQDANNQTFGQLTNAMTTNADVIGMAVIFGMMILMMLNAFVVGKRSKKLMLVADVFILVFAFILSVYISQIFEIFINSSSILDVFINDMPDSSKFILTLPLIVSTLGVILMILSYTGINQGVKEVNVLGY